MAVHCVHVSVDALDEQIKQNIILSWLIGLEHLVM